MKRILGVFAAVLVLSAAVACSGDDGTGPDDNNNNNNNNSTMTASIAGANFTPSVILAARSGNDLSIFGRDAANTQIDIFIDEATGAGTFSIGNGAPATVTLSTQNGQVWVGHLAGATGSVIITTLTSQHMVGSFNVTLQPQTATGATGTRVVSGTFTGYFGQT
jgi:hypothetical protein